MSKTKAGVRHDFKTDQYVPTLDGKDISPTSFDEARALQIAQAAASAAATQHTPGPWWTVGSSQTSILQGDKHDPQVVATTETGDTMNVESYAECIANARLIASAPDLLAACKKADALLNDTTAVRKILRAAIAKAEGRAE